MTFLDDNNFLTFSIANHLLSFKCVTSTYPLPVGEIFNSPLNVSINF
jgi:hypothetical protein